MTRFKYQGEEYDLVDPDAWTTLEAVKLEFHSGRKPVQLMQDLLDGAPLGIHGAVWVSLRRAGIDLAWNELELPWLETLNSFRGDPVTEPPDPSTASTASPKAARRTRSVSARSPKK